MSVQIKCTPYCPYNTKYIQTFPGITVGKIKRTIATTVSYCTRYREDIITLATGFDYSPRGLYQIRSEKCEYVDLFGWKEMYGTAK